MTGFDVDRALAEADVIPKLEQHRLRPSQQLESEFTAAAKRDGLTAGTEMLIDDRGNIRWIAVVITQRGAMRQVVTASRGDDVDDAWRVAFMKLGLELTG